MFRGSHKLTVTASTSKLSIVPLVLAVLCLTACEQPKIDMIQEIQSPDGRFIAYVFEKNSGATSRFVYRLTILKSEDEFKVSNGNTYYSYNEFDVEWLNNTTLKVNNTSDKDIFLQKKQVGDVTVEYSYLKE